MQPEHKNQESRPGAPQNREPRWPASLAATAALILYLTLPAKLTIGPGWVIPVLEAALIIPLTITAPDRHPEEVALVRFASLLLIGLVNLANLTSLALLVHVVLAGGLVTGRQLIFSGFQIWLTLVLAFALWYWELDRGGPTLRRFTDERPPDFLFPQMATPELRQPDWMPGFMDYLYVSFTNATAFSPTDTMPLTARAKALMLTEALASIITVVMVAGRAVNTLK
ncbi:MAG: hypothetical protein QOH48_1742 [Actinomycetota bacterium]|nr:hypothetical protein [Actinomycetota bacterium]